MRLSERIDQADYDCRSIWTYLEAAKHPVNGDAADRLKAVMQTLTDCGALAKRYEDAPVANFLWGDPSELVAAAEHLSGQRVRIVLDKEG